MSQLHTWFPIQDGPAVPWSYMMPHESQAKRNHGQTLTRLAERGGLGAAEAELIVTAQPLSPKSGEWDWAELKRRWVERAERVNNAYLTAGPEPLAGEVVNGLAVHHTVKGQAAPPKVVITITDLGEETSIATAFFPPLKPLDPATPMVELAMDINKFIATRVAANAARSTGG